MDQLIHATPRRSALTVDSVPAFTHDREIPWRREELAVDGNIPREWRRSSRCASSTCVEVAVLPDAAYVRDGKNPGGTVLRFEAPAWHAFLSAVRTGRL